MGDLLPNQFERKLAEKNFDIKKEPCSECVDQPHCNDGTCHDARMWWAIFAKKFRGGTLGE